MQLFPKYKVKSWRVGHTIFYGIGERWLLFFYPRIAHTKVVAKVSGTQSSHEILTFRSREEAENEIDCLNFGFAKIVTSYYENGELTGVSRSRPWTK